MSKDRRSTVDGDILDEILKENGTKRNRNGELKGLQQYQTPYDLARQLVAKLNIHPGQTVYDPQCGHGNLLNCAPYSSTKFGVDLDPATRSGISSIHWRIATGASAKFASVMDEVIDPCWHVDFAVANPPFGLRWGGIDSTEWTLRHCMQHANAGLLIGNAATIERMGLHEWPEVYAYDKVEDVWDNVEVVAGVIYWRNKEPKIATNPRNLASKWEQAGKIVSEERSNRRWNFWLDAYGRMRTFLSTRLKLTQKITHETAQNLLALDGQTPMSLVGDFKARRTMQSMIDAGYYAIEPECEQAIADALEEAHTAECPIMPVTDFELVAYAEANGSLVCDNPEVRIKKPQLDEDTKARIEKLEALIKDPAASEGEIENARSSIYRLETAPMDSLFTRGKSYDVDSQTYKFSEKFDREKVHLEESTLRTYTMSHACQLNGRERKVIIRDDFGDYHEFLDRPDPNTADGKQYDHDKGVHQKVHSHPESDLWSIFKRPEVPTVKERFPDQVRHHHEVMDSLEMVGGFEFKPGQREYLSRYAVKDFGLPAAETGCHAKGTKVLMFDGRLKKVEDIRVGDVLQGWDDTPRRVRKLARGRQQMARITPVKGEPFTVNLDHILTLVRTNSGESRPNESHLAGRIVDVSVREYLSWNKTKKHVHKLFRKGVDHWPHRSHPHSPYFIGIMLGDGACGHGQVGITKPDVEIRDAVQSECNRYGWGMRTTKGNNPTYFIRCGGMLTQWLKDEDLKVGSGGKYIPHRYKVDSRENRLEILAGLIDTDGSLVKSGAGYDFISKSKALAEDVAFIARSLGLAAYVKPCTKRCQGGFKGTYRRVSISGDCSIIPCRIPRKQAACRKQKKDPLRTGFQVELIDESNYYGFTTEGDGRYLMGDFTVTHNCGKTLLAIATIAMKGPKHALIIAPKGTVKEDRDPTTGERSVAQWISEINRFAPWADVYTFTNEAELNAHRDDSGELPKGIYISYYECMFGNNALEFAPKTWKNRKLYPMIGKRYEPHMVEQKSPVSGEIKLVDANDGADWLANMGSCGRIFAEHETYMSQAAGIKCLAKPCMAELYGREFDMVVADEAHKACNLTANLTDALIRLQPKYRFAFTATPISNKASNLFSLLGWLCVPDWYKGGRCNAAFPYRREDMGRFCDNFLSKERDITAEEIALQNEKQRPPAKPSPILSSPARLLKLIKPTLAYVSKPDCDPEYERPEVIDVRVPMGLQQGRLYAHFMERGNILHKNGMTRAGVQIGILRSICAEPFTSRYNGARAAKFKCSPCRHEVKSPFNPKLQTILGLTRDVLEEERQVVIVNSRLDLTDCIAARLEACGVPYSRIDTKSKRHAAEAQDFKAGKTRVMLMGIKCAQAYSFDQCDRLIIGSMEYSYGSFEQAKGRIDRITSRGTKIYCVLVANSIEETVFDSVATKQDSAAICLLGKRVPRSFKPVDMGELLAKSFEAWGDRSKNLIDEEEMHLQWPNLRQSIIDAYNGTTAAEKLLIA